MLKEAFTLTLSFPCRLRNTSPSYISKLPLGSFSFCFLSWKWLHIWETKLFHLHLLPNIFDRSQSCRFTMSSNIVSKVMLYFIFPKHIESLLLLMLYMHLSFFYIFFFKPSNVAAVRNIYKSLLFSEFYFPIPNSCYAVRVNKFLLQFS